MVYINYANTCIISSIYLNIAMCSLIVKIKMVSFKSDGRLDHSNIRCDHGNCDNYFKLCVLNSELSDNCIKTDTVYRNRNEFEFPTELPNYNSTLPQIPNPFEVKILEWPKKVSDRIITLEVHDRDKKDDDLLYRNSTNIGSILPFRNELDEPKIRIIENSNGETSTKINVWIYCDLGFTGPSCSQRDTECHSNTCLNKGQCIETGERVKCKCTGGYGGDRCEIRSDPCKLGNCKYGNCTVDWNSYTCSCFHGYTGDDCDEDVDECVNSPCHHGGTCVNLQPGFRCECPTGRTGNLCALDVDECASNPCLNYGVCTHGINQFNCECIEGFHGEWCEIDINECGSSPCLNGGICIDEINSHKCICQEGFNGPFCENNINRCSSTSCKNDGLCIEITNGLVCNCPNGFAGDTCEININECSSNPCLHGGKCVDGLGIYACRCQKEYVGQRCELDSSTSGTEISVKDELTLDLSDLELKFADLIKEHVPGTDDVVVQTFVPANQNQEDDITQVVFVIFINNTMIAGNDAGKMIDSIPEGERAKLIKSDNKANEGAIELGKDMSSPNNNNILEGMILGIIVFQAIIILLILIRWRRNKRYSSVQRQEQTIDETTPV